MRKKNLDFLVYILLFSSNKQLLFIYKKKKKKDIERKMGTTPQFWAMQKHFIPG